jgi:hypothetical protein
MTRPHLSRPHVVFWVGSYSSDFVVLYYRCFDSLNSVVRDTYGEVLPAIAKIMKTFPPNATYELLEMRDD